MRQQTRAIFILLLLATAFMRGGGGFYSRASSHLAARNPPRIRFEVAALEERDGARSLLSATTVEGPAGTDFTIRLQGTRFQMNARFMTDLMGADVLKMKADLNTRRLYGYSERNLPLYEEDAQKETMQLGFEEKLVLLPFGRSDSSDQLKIEITPFVSEHDAYLPDGTARPLEIKIPKAGPNGAISVQASRIPHRYTVEAALLEDGREVALGAGDYRIEEAGELSLHAGSLGQPGAADLPLRLNLTIDQYIRSRPSDQVAFSFALFDGRAEPLIPKAAGIAALGSELSYDLGQSNLAKTGRKYELRLKVRLAPGESAD